MCYLWSCLYLNSQWIIKATKSHLCYPTYHYALSSANYSIWHFTFRSSIIRSLFPRSFTKHDAERIVLAMSIIAHCGSRCYDISICLYALFRSTDFVPWYYYRRCLYSTFLLSVVFNNANGGARFFCAFVFPDHFLD